MFLAASALLVVMVSPLDEDKIDFDVKGVPVRKVLNQLLGSNDRFKIDADVGGTISVTYKSVPLETVLSMVLSQVRATYRLKDSVYIVERKTEDDRDLVLRQVYDEARKREIDNLLDNKQLEKKFELDETPEAPHATDSGIVFGQPSCPFVFRTKLYSKSEQGKLMAVKYYEVTESPGETDGFLVPKGTRPQIVGGWNRGDPGWFVVVADGLYRNVVKRHQVITRWEQVKE